MIRFLTPAEQRLLDSVTARERLVLLDMFNLLDARLIDDGEPIAPVVPPATLFDQEAA